MFFRAGINTSSLLQRAKPFLLSRIMSYGLDLVSMIILVEILLFDDMVSKVIANILVIIFNYLASKFFVFRQLAEVIMNNDK